MKRLFPLIVLALVIAGCRPVPAPLPTSTPPPTATPAPTLTPQPTPTLDPAADMHLEVAGGTGPLAITYIGNEGFLIEGGGKKVAIDALFRGFQADDIPVERQQLMRQAAPPFDDIDLILVTHSHGDHFEASIVSDHLVNNPSTVLVSTDDTIRMVRELYPGDDFDQRAFAYRVERGQREAGTFNGIDVTIIYLSHGGGGVRNNGYVLSLAGYKFLHMGDYGEESIQPVLSYHLPDERLDFAFVPYFYMMEEDLRPIVTEGIQARYYIPMHFYSTFERKENIFAVVDPAFPSAILFYTELQTLFVSPEQ